MLWAVYRQDSNGNRSTVGVGGVFTTKDGEEIKVWDLENEAAALAAAERIEASHYHPHKADYFTIPYSAGMRAKAFRQAKIEIM